jgi:hypothetical protein
VRETVAKQKAETAALRIPCCPVRRRLVIRHSKLGGAIVVMRELGLKRVLTEDRHFAQVGWGLELVP